MSHPIDDIFKKGLGDLSSIDGHATDWVEAKKLLQLNKRKRRPVLIWIFLGVLIGSAGLINYYYDQQAVNLDIKPTQPAIEITSNESSSAITKLEKGATPTLKESGQDEKNDNDSSSDSNLSNHQSLVRATVETAEVNSNNSILEKDNYNNRALNDDAPFEREDSELVGLQELNPGVAVDRSGARAADPDDGPSLTQDSVFLTISDIVKISIEPLELPEVSISSIDNVIFSTDNQAKTYFGYGLYVDGDPTKRQAGGGGFVSLTLGGHWSMDFGVGLGRERSGSAFQYEDLQLANQLNAFGNLTSSNYYNLSSVFIPIRLIRTYDRHLLFVGANLKRPFALNGRQEASLVSDVEIDMGAPTPPGSTNTFSNDPIMAIRDYNLSNTPELNRFLVYANLGYGYQFAQRVQISLAANYRLSSLQDISPLVRSADRMATREDRWGMTLRLNYYIR